MDNNKLPDVSQWMPRVDKQNALRNTLLQTCRSIEQRIIAEALIEKNFNIDNYDSGPGIEDIVRQQFNIVIPTRYLVTPGVVIDRDGNTCGDCDLVLTNNYWLPFIKFGATDDSRRVHIPVEAVYSVIEIKQSINEKSLDEAMKKIVMYKRLHRDYTKHFQIIENTRLRFLDTGEYQRDLNYRYDIILGINCKEDDVELLVKRFFLINNLLAPSERVNALAILGHGFACYVAKTESGVDETMYPEMHDTEHLPFFLETKTDTFFHLYTNLWQHLSRTVLNFDGFKHSYGRKNADIQGRFISF